MQPRVAVLFGFGINCDHETKAVFELVGATADRIHVNRFVSGDVSLGDYDILAVPGGFRLVTIWEAAACLETECDLLCGRPCKRSSRQENRSSAFATDFKCW